MKPVNKIRLIVALVAVTILSGGCEKENENTTGSTLVAAQFTSTIEDRTTRAAGMAWAQGDAIGVSGKTETTEYKNVKFVTTAGDGIFTTVNNAGEDNDIYFEGMTPVDFTAYYPYAGSKDTPASKITADATEQTPAEQAKYDFLFAQATGSATNPKVQLRFRHRMSRIILNFLPGNDIASLDDIKYTISTLALEGTFDTVKGEAEGSNTNVFTQSIPYDASGMSSSLIVFPQQADKAGITFTMRGTIYTGTIEFPENKSNNNVREFVPGYSYTYNIKVNKSTFIISSANIQDWETVPPKQGSAFPE